MVKQRELPPAILIGFLCGLVVEIVLGGYKDAWCQFNMFIPSPDEVLEWYLVAVHLLLLNN